MFALYYTWMSSVQHAWPISWLFKADRGLVIRLELFDLLVLEFCVLQLAEIYNRSFY